MKSSIINIGNGVLSKCLKSLCLVVAIVAGMIGDVWGAEYKMRERQRTDTEWNDTKTWDPNGVPGSNDIVEVNRNGKNLIINVANAQCNNFTFSSGTIDIRAGNSLTINGNLSISGGSTTLNVDGTITIHNVSNSTTYPHITGSGTIIVENGTLNCNLDGFSGTLRMSNITRQLCGDFSIETNSYTATSTIPGGTYTNLTVNGNVDLCGDVTVTGSLTWNNYRIKLGGHSFTLEKNATITSGNNYDDSHYFVFPNQATSGFVTFKGDLSRLDDNVVDGGIIIPVGNVNGSSYRIRPVTISATTTATSSFSVRPTNGVSVGNPDSDLKCHWTTVAENIGTATLKFTHIGTEYPLGSDLHPYYKSEDEWMKFSDGGYSNPNITFTGCTVNGEQQWSACEDVKTYYSFTTGNWNSASSWTFDPAGIDRTGANIPETGPTSGSRVVIKNPDIITVTENNISLKSLIINDGGVIDLSTYTGHYLGTVKGKGTLKLASATFPRGTFNTFVSAGGGTVEFYNANSFVLPIRGTTGTTTYNNLVLNMAGGATATLKDDNLKTNGNFIIKQGTFQIGENSNSTIDGCTITVCGDLTVESLGNIITGNANVGSGGSTATYKGTPHYGHKLELQGNFTNNGTVSFTRQNNLSYSNASSKVTNVFFTKTTGDQNVVINGSTKFYSIRVQKGVDKTHVLNIDATEDGQFLLWGPRTDWPYGGNSSEEPTSDHFLALAIEAGTVRLGSNIEIDALIDGNRNGYKIDESACLWIDGAKVAVGDISNLENSFALYVHGDLHVSNGTFDVSATRQGIVYRTSANIILDDGIIKSKMLRTSQANGGAGVNVGSLTINGGTFELTGNNTDKNYAPTFGLTFSAGGFNMSGGEFIIHKGTSSGDAENFGFVLGTNIDNCSITGGTVRLLCENWNGASDFYINSTVPLWNLEIVAQSNANKVQVTKFTSTNSNCKSVPVQPLVILNNLTIKNNGTLDTKGQNLYVGGNFNIEATGTYTPGDNTTFFNGSSVQELTVGGTITSGFNNLTIAENANLHLQSNAEMRGTLTMESGSVFDDLQHTLAISGNIVNNSGVHYNSGSSAGGILLSEGTDQTIGGDGHGSFNNLRINKNGGSVTMTANATITGNLRLISNNVLNIGTYNLNLNDADAAIYSNNSNGTDFGPDKMIKTAGNNSDGGITKLYSSTDKFLFPFGFGNYYLPAEIAVDIEPTTYGTITSRPVNGKHYVLGNEIDALKCFWHNTSNGFSGVTSVNHYYYYAQNLAEDGESSYVPAYFHSGLWYPNNNTSLVYQNNDYFYWESCTTIDGDFTCGTADAFSRAPDHLYSVSNGAWHESSTWEDDNGVSGVPGSNTIVVIRDGHTVTVEAERALSGSLSIAENAVLDLIVCNDNHNFGLLAENGDVDGKGTLIIRGSNYFPKGDFGDFLGEGGGTVKYYAADNDISIPAGVATYNNLELFATGEHSVTMPDANIEVFGNLTSNSANDTYYNQLNTVATQRTVIVDGNLNVETGTLAFNSSEVQKLVVKGSVNVSENANFNVKSVADFTNQLTIYGDLNVNGALDFANVDQEVTMTFTGAADAAIKGTGDITLYTLTCDKGFDATPVLSVENKIETDYTGDIFLDLRNGTFRANGDVDIYITRGADFEIRSTACLSTKEGTIHVCYTDDQSKKVSLHGKIEVLGGNMIVGNGSHGNDIEYSSAQAQIDIQGGMLTVGGQIRRPYTMTPVDLHYSQLGGDVVILGKDRDQGASMSRAVIDICNNGSFTMSGGKITIVDVGDNSPSQADILLTPATSSVTGGTIAIGNADSPVEKTIYMSASAELGNIEVGADGKELILTLVTNHVDINGSVTIIGSSSLNANGFNINIAGDFTCPKADGFTAGAVEQTTTFDGTSPQTIIGGGGTTVINFSNLTIDNPTTVQLSRSTVNCNGLLTISRGELDDAGRKINAKASVVNNSRHVSSIAGGGLVFSGNGIHEMQSSSGQSGTYGNLIVESYTEMKNPVTVTGTITLKGDIYANDYRLTLMPESTFDGGSTGMVILNGAIGDAGVRKYIANDFSGDFLFRIGVPDQYTPAKYTFTAAATSANGYINIKPLNNLHAAISSSPTDYLNYYWMVNSEGLSGYTVTHEYYYTDDLLTLTNPENENMMVSQNYINGKWEHYGANVTPEDNKFAIEGIEIIEGEYTAGFPSYSQLPPYFSVKNGSWTEKETWHYFDDNGVEQEANVPPKGNPITIRSDNTVTIDVNSPQFIYSLDIEEGAMLDIGSTVGHNFGIVMGGGTLKLGEISGGGVYSFMVPAGKYDEFFSNTKSTIIFDGNHAAVLPAKPGNYDKPLPNIILRGSGAKTITASVFSVKGDVTIENGCQLNNSTYNRDFYLGGDFIDKNTVNCGYNCGTSKVIFCGTRAQNIDVKVDANFYNVQINNSHGVDVTNGGAANKNVVVANNLTLTNGNFTTNADALIYLSSTNQNVVSGGSNSSFVDGPLRKKINPSGSFDFPVGNDGRYGNVKLASVSNGSSASADWTAEYFNIDPSADYPTAEENYDVLTLGGISNNEYWIVTRPNGSSSAKVGLRWDDQSSPFSTIAQIEQRLKVVEHDGVSQWSVREATASGNATAGMMTTDAAVTQDNYVFTFGYADVIAAITTTETQQICNDGVQTASINVSLSGTAPFTLTYSVNGVNFTQSSINASSYSISRNSSQLGGTPGTYTVGLVSVSDANQTGSTLQRNGTIEVLTAYTPTFTDGVTVAGTGETRTYTVETHGSNTYNWVWDGDGPNLTNANTNSVTTTYGDNAATYNLIVTETTDETGCAVSNTLTITVSTTPQPSFTAKLNICEGESYTYSTADISGHHYQWYIDDVKVGDDSHSLEVNWGNYSIDDHRIYVNETNSSGIDNDSPITTITIYASPATSTIEDIASICSGNTATVTLNSTLENVTYKLYRTDAANAVNTFSGNGGSQNFTTNPIAEVGPVYFYAEASNPGCAVRIPAAIDEYKVLKVKETPIVTLNWPTIYQGVPTIIPYTSSGSEALSSYYINYIAGGINDGGNLGDITVKAKSDIEGVITITNEDNCSADIPFSQPMADGYVWSGEMSSEWKNTSNWYSGAEPDHEHDAIIRVAANNPKISTAAEAKSVKIESGVLTITEDKTLDVYGDWQNEVGNDGFVGNTSTVAFNNDAEISGNTTFGSISVLSGKAVNIGSGHITVNGDVTNDGTLSGSEGSTLEMAGTTSTDLDGGSYNLANLKINKTSGEVTANTEIKVNGEFAIYGGILNMSGNTLVLGSNATTAYDDGNKDAYVNGEMAKIGVSSIVFPIGNNGRRAMVGIDPDVANASTRFTANYVYIPKDPNAEPTTPDPMDDGMVRVSKMDNWEISGSNGASAYVTLYWDEGDVSEITELESLTIAHWNGSKWEMLAATATGEPAKGRIRTNAPVTSFSPFTFGSTDVNENPLPVEIASFTGRQNGNSVVLEWTTMSEKENDYFEIERSIDGINFVTIGFVQGAGNSTEKLAYSFADNAPEQGIAYYRLSQVDYDGTRSFADKVISLSYINGNIRLVVVPNPTRGMFKVSITGVIGGSAKLMTQSGKTVKIIDIHNSAESINISDLPSGIYILQYQTGENVVHERVVKL